MRWYLACAALLVGMAHLVVGIQAMTGGTSAASATQVAIAGAMLVLAAQQTLAHPGIATVLALAAAVLDGVAAGTGQASLYGYAGIAMMLAVLDAAMALRAPKPPTTPPPAGDAPAAQSPRVAARRRRRPRPARRGVRQQIPRRGR